MPIYSPLRPTDEVVPATAVNPLRPDGDIIDTEAAISRRFGKGQDAARSLASTAASLSAATRFREAQDLESTGGPEFDARLAQAKEEQRTAELTAPRVRSLRDINGVGDFVDYAQGVVPGAAVTMAPSIAAAVALRGAGGRLGKALPYLGAAAPGYLMERDEAVAGQYMDPALAATPLEDRQEAARNKGLVNAGLEAIVPGSIGSSLLRKPAGNLLGHVGRDMLTEGATEAAQEVSGHLFNKSLDPNQQLDPMDLADAAAAGALGGGGISLAGRAPSHLMGGTGDALSEQAEKARAAFVPPKANDDGTIDLNPQAPAPDVTVAEDPASKGKSWFDRVYEARQNSSGVGDFLAQTLGMDAHEQAAQDLVDDRESPEILNAQDPAAAMEQRDAAKAGRAAQYAQQLMESPGTPDYVKQRIDQMAGDFAHPDNQRFLADTLVGQKAGEAFGKAISSAFDAVKNIGVSKNNLQDIPLTESKPLIDLLSTKLGADADKAPDLARQLMAVAARLTPEGSMPTSVAKRLMNLSDVVGEDVLSTVSELSNNPAFADAIERVRAIPRARIDVRDSRGSSFFESMLTLPLSQSQKGKLADLIDDYAPKFEGENDLLRERKLGALADYFGTAKRAQTVVEYYGKLRSQAMKEQAIGDEVFETAPKAKGDTTYEDAAAVAEWGGLTEGDGPKTEFGFREAASKTPFRKFVGEDLSNGKIRREAHRAITDARGREDMNYTTVDYGDYQKQQGVAPEQAVAERLAYIDKTIKGHEARKGEDRSQSINALRGERALLEKTVKEKGPEAALNELYEVTARAERESQDLVATDDDIKAMKVSVAKPDVRGMKPDAARKALEKHEGTLVRFERTDGKILTLSAKSMVHALGIKRREKGGRSASIDSPNQVFADAAAHVLARDDISKMLTDPKSIHLDAEDFKTVERRPNPERMDALKRFSDVAAENGRSVPARRAKIRETVDKVDEDLDGVQDRTDLDELEGETLKSVDDKIDTAKKALEKFKKEKDDLLAKFQNTPKDSAERSGAWAAYELARAKYDFTKQAVSDFVEMRKAISDKFFERRREMDDAEKSGFVEIEDRGPAEPESIEKRGERAVMGTLAINAKQTTIGESSGRKMTPAEQKAVRDEIARIRGDQVKVRIGRLIKKLGGSGQYNADEKRIHRLIEIASDAANPMGVAWHESLHDFFAMLGADKASRSIKRDLIDAANAPHVKRQLEKLLEKHPAALEQIRTDPEERVAYMYQFWAAGELTLGPTGNKIFNAVREFFRDLFKLVNSTERAEDLLNKLHEGEFADMGVVAEVLADLPRERLVNRMERLTPGIVDVTRKLFDAAPERLRAFQNDHLNTLADKFSSETGKLGFVQKRFQQEGVWTNRLAGVLKGTTAKERRAALEEGQNMAVPTTPLGRELRKLFEDMHKYMLDAGVETLDRETNQWVPLRQVKNYFPRVFDRTAIEKDRAGFEALLMAHGGMTKRAAHRTAEAIIRGSGQLDLAENEHALGFTPYAQAVQDRQLKFINPSNAADFAKYQSKDLADITTGYVKQAVHRAEYAREFGNDGAAITELIAKSKITDPKELEAIQNTVRGLEGTLGSEMSPATKELMSGLMTVQNLVLLPLAIFSQMVDPVVMAARSGELADAGNAYVTAVKRLFKKPADGEDLAEMLGIVSEDSVLEAMGNAYGTAYMSKRMRNINRVFFKYNGMQGWNNSMRIAATAAGERYLIQHKNDAKALNELGLTPNDIRVKQVNGRDRLDVSSDKIKEAMYRFVDQSVIRPSASNRPVWMSDPKFLLLAHLKQFTFAMHNVVLKRANQQLDEGNPKPWAILALAMPTILAADMAKFALMGGTPPGWGAKELALHAIERSGLLGLGDFAAQATRGDIPGLALLGPSVENLGDILRWVGGDPTQSFEDVVKRTIPGTRFI